MSTVLRGGLPTIPTEIVGSSNSPVDSTPNTRGSTHQAKMTTHPTSRTPEKKEVPTRSQNSKFTSDDKRKNKTAPMKTRAIRPAPEEHRRWLLQPITFDYQDYSRGARNVGWTALVLNPVIDGLQFTRVLMDGGSDLNLLYQDTIRKLGVNPAIIRHGSTSFQGVTPGPDTQSMGSLSLEVTFGSPDNFRSEKLTFHIAPFVSRHQALLGRGAFAHFNAIPHYASLTLKMPGPRCIISLQGNFN